MDELDKSMKKENKSPEDLSNVSGEHSENTSISKATERNKTDHSPEGIFKVDTDKQNINNYEVQNVLSDKITCVDIDSAKNEKYGSVINVFPGTLVKENCATDFVANTEAQSNDLDTNSNNLECIRQTKPNICDNKIVKEQTEKCIKGEIINSLEDDDQIKHLEARVKLEPKASISGCEKMSINIADEKQMKEKIDEEEGYGRNFEIVKQPVKVTQYLFFLI